jgi:EAL domain-containing protein (putative c-di-GMP-specific phosphodiesterase class I)
LNKPDHRDIHTEILSLKASLFDSVTRFPAYSATFEHLKQMAQDRLLGLVFLQLSDLERVEAIFGFQRYEEILKRTARQVEVVNQTRFDGALLPTMRGVFDDEFCVFVPCEMLTESPQTALQAVAEMLYAALDAELASGGLQGLTLNLGCAILHYNPFLRFERLVHRTVEEASTSALRQDETERVLRELEIRQILAGRALSTVFHPIVDLRDFSAMGYEALTRGPVGSPYEAPETLFAFARESKLTQELDRQCKMTAIASAHGRPAQARLFINTLPSTLDDPEFMDGKALELLSSHDIAPADIVWELTERLPIDDYTRFEATMKAHTDLGYQVAIDDVGAGYSSIQTITHVRPLYLKVDHSLIIGVEENLLKQELIASIQVLAQKVGAMVIAEGIQTERELGVVRGLGVPFGQGFLFGIPAQGFSPHLRPPKH